jgi:lipoic acid synthetase
MKLKHAVITSVDRDDLKDGGSGIWAECIKEIKVTTPETTMEVLIPDFNGKEEDVQRVIDQNPEVISHNLETVRRLTPEVRSRARYDVSLKVLKQIADSGIVAKSGIMLGLGETEEEIYETMDDLLSVGVRVMTIGQYLQPTRKHLELQEYITPEVFKKYEQVGLEKGFSFVESTPLVRSSYHAERHVNALNLKQVLKND